MTLLQQLQEGIPLVPQPYHALAETRGTSAEELLSQVADLRAQKLIRRLSPIYDTHQLGYDSSLVAFRLPAEELESAAQIVNAHPGVSHNYERTHSFNLWFTLAVSPASQMGLEATVEHLARLTGAHQVAILRSVKMYKIGVKLDLDGQAPERAAVESTHHPRQPLTEREREVVRLSQEELALDLRPFDSQAARLGLRPEELLETLRQFQARGLLRRFAAILHHRKVGFSANGMGVWQVPTERLDSCGETMASFSAVSHCYQRSLAPAWPYNLFTMVHGRSREEVEETLARIRDACGLPDFSVLYSTREFKKHRILYFGPQEREWEESCVSKLGKGLILS
ncbi:Lrp/AsnC family transcriptional regulator [bacterium]|nr:Lrp/AsnC family transcriptional regulator [bacterium]